MFEWVNSPLGMKLVSVALGRWRRQEGDSGSMSGVGRVNSPGDGDVVAGDKITTVVSSEGRSSGGFDLGGHSLEMRLPDVTLETPAVEELVWTAWKQVDGGVVDIELHQALVSRSGGRRLVIESIVASELGFRAPSRTVKMPAVEGEVLYLRVRQEGRLDNPIGEWEEFLVVAEARAKEISTSGKGVVVSRVKGT